MTHAVLTAGLLALLAAGTASPPAGTAPPPVGTESDAATGFVLREVHTMTGGSNADTLVTSLAPGRVRVSHRDGDAILDEPNDRFILLAPTDRTYRIMSLTIWEQRIGEALAAAAQSRHSAASGDTTRLPAPDSLHFESMGQGGRVAGYACERFHLFTQREIFPGEVEAIEQEIWLTRELELPSRTYATYRRVVANLDRIELDAPIERPPGVALRTVIRRRAIDRPPGSEETEANEVIAVERRPIPASAFAIPPGYAPADSTPKAPRSSK